MQKMYGYLRETTESAIKAGVDPDTGLQRMGLNEYLAEIFPDVHDWIHDKSITIIKDGKTIKPRPDYRSETLKLIVEFDGVLHFQTPLAVRNDREMTKSYEELGYKVVRIPFFIQLTRDSILKMFGVDMGHEMFDPSVPSFSLKMKCTPAFFCHAGVLRMAEYFIEFPDQFEANLTVLGNMHDDELSGYSQLISAMAEVRSR